MQNIQDLDQIHQSVGLDILYSSLSYNNIYMYSFYMLLRFFHTN